MIDSGSEIINSAISSFRIQNCLDSVGQLKFLEEEIEHKIPFGLVFQYEPDGHYYINLEGDVLLNDDYEKSNEENTSLSGGSKGKFKICKKRIKNSLLSKSIKKYSTNNKSGGMFSEDKQKTKEDIIGEIIENIDDDINLSILVFKINFDNPNNDLTEHLNITKKDHIIPIDQTHSIIIKKIKKVVSDTLNDIELVSYNQLKDDLDHNQSVSISDSIFNLIGKLKKKTQKKFSNLKKSVVGGKYKKYSKIRRKKERQRNII